MAGKRKKGRKKGKQAANTVFQRIVSVTESCFWRRKRNPQTSVSASSCEELLEKSHGQEVKMLDQPEQTILQKSLYSIEVSKEISNRDAVHSNQSKILVRAADNIPTPVHPTIGSIMQVIFAEYNHMMWLLPYLSERDEVSTELISNDQATENIKEQLDKECTLLVKSAEIEKQKDAGGKTTTENTFDDTLSLPPKLLAEEGTTVLQKDISEEYNGSKEQKKGIRKHKQLQRSRYLQSQKDTEKLCNQLQIQEGEITDKSREKMMDGFEVHYSCLMDDFYFDLLEVKAMTLSGKFGTTFQASYDGNPVEITFHCENFPTVDPGRLLILRSNFVSRALMYMQDDNELDCIIYPDNYIGTIWDLMEADPHRRYLGEEHALFILSGLMEGIKHISSKRIVHGHLTPDLVRLNRKGYPVICDFTFAYSYKPGKLVQSRSEEFNMDYLAPEVANGTQIVPESDIFAAGCIAYESIVGIPPFTGNGAEQTVSNVLDKNYRIEFDTRLFSENTAAVVATCLRRNVDERREWEEMYDFLLEPDLTFTSFVDCSIKLVGVNVPVTGTVAIKKADVQFTSELDIDQQKESFLLPLIRQLLKI